MQATITYLLSEQAQRAEMVATSQPVTRKQTMTIDITPQNLPLFPVAADGTITLDLTVAYPREYEALVAAGARKTNICSQIEFDEINPDIVRILQDGRIKLAEKKAENEALVRANGEYNRRVTEEAYRKFLADPAARTVDVYDGVDSLVPDRRSPADWHPSNHQAFVDELARRRTIDEKAKQDRAAAKEQAKNDFIVAWFTDPAKALAERSAEDPCGFDWDEATRQQFADGMLSRQDALDLIAADKFRAAGVPDEYHPTICGCRSCSCGRTEIKSIPRGIYPTIRTLKTALPQGATIELESVRECLRDEDGFADGEDASEPIYAALVTLPVGPFTFKRLVRL